MSIVLGFIAVVIIILCLMDHFDPKDNDLNKLPGDLNLTPHVKKKKKNKYKHKDVEG